MERTFSAMMKSPSKESTILGFFQLSTVMTSDSGNSGAFGEPIHCQLSGSKQGGFEPPIEPNPVVFNFEGCKIMAQRPKCMLIRCSEMPLAKNTN